MDSKKKSKLWDDYVCMKQWPFVNPISVCVYPTAIGLQPVFEQLSMVIDSPAASGLCVVHGDAGCTDEASFSTYAMLSQPPASAEYVTGVGGTDGSPRQIWPGVHRSPPLNKRFLVLFFALRVHTGEPSSPLGPSNHPPPLFHRLMPLTNRVFARTSSLHFDIHRYIQHSTPITVLCAVATRLLQIFGCWAGNPRRSFSSFWSYSTSLQPIKITQDYQRDIFFHLKMLSYVLYHLN